MRVTLRQIADRHGVSAQTVSQAINGTGVLRDQTRHAILKTASEMGYRPNAWARAMRTGRSGAIGVLINADTAFTASLMSPIAHAAQARGLKVMVSLLPGSGLMGDDSPLPPLLSERSVDGVIVLPGLAWEAIREPVAAAGLPCVRVGADQPYDAVLLDQRQAGRAATERLLALGHRRIAFADYSGQAQRRLTQPDAHDAPAYVLGYADAMRQAGLDLQLLPAPAPRASVLEVEPALPSITMDERAAHSAQWLALPERPTAVLAAAYSTALPIYFAAASLARLHVPTDLSLVVVSGGIAQRVAMPLTRLALPEQELGAGALAMLLRKIAQPAQPIPSLRLPIPLVDGLSVAPPSH